MGLAELIDHRLPLNRKEPFYTGTVFPTIVACHEFRHLDRFLSLAGLRDWPAIEPDAATTRVQFFTEYNFAESRLGVAEDRFPTVPTGDTPDIVIYVEGEPGGGPGAIIGVEAKMFHRPSVASLHTQLTKQKKVLEGIVGDLGRGDSLHQVALLPQRLSRALGPALTGALAEIPAQLVTWEQLLDRYEGVAPRYWQAMLREALGRYGKLVSKGPDFGQNNDGHLTGQAIVDGCRDGTLAFTWMGRQGGLNGAKLASDLATGGWRAQSYEVRIEPLDKTNWFSIAKFVERVDAMAGVQ